ncbi:MAG TPA: penicillin acylase family protein [Frankiaceae bacterium]|nr:penicillin acylase family protein [Frankiaceae bacterium]
MRALRAAVPIGLVTCLVLGGCSGGSKSNAPDGGRTNATPLQVLSILPPGENGSSNQRDMYDALNRVDPASLKDPSLGDYYKNAPLDPAPGDVVSTEAPRPGVTIKRDRFGVPYVYGTTDNDTAYGAGYAGTQDRMFVMDAIRYAGAGRLSELEGGTPSTLTADADQLRQADYTPQEAQAQLDALRDKGQVGIDLLARLDAFVDGVNAARQKLCPTTSAPTCPAPYKLLKLTPTPYTKADVVYTASLVGGMFGKGGGQEAQNALFLRQLQAKLGAGPGRQVLADLRTAQDPNAPTTNPGAAPYGAPGPIDPAAVALPDLASSGAKLVPGTGPVPANARTGAANSATGAGGGAGSGGPDWLQVPRQMSNALLVAGSHTTSGKPIAVMGPQTAYQAPNFFDEIALHGPHQEARGVAFANLQFAVLIGHGKNYAWSATSASGDVIDTVFDRLCNLDGTPATPDSTGYLDGSTCTPMTGTPHQEHDSTGKVVATFPDLRTRHGIVQYRTTANGAPVAVVSQRSTYGHEPDSVVGFAQMNDPTTIHGARDFTDAFSKLTFSFNWFYVDDRDIATFTSGALPLRATGVDPDLPRWGDPRWDWTGFLPAAGHPQSVNPPSGYLVSWNNKPSSGTYSADDEWGWGPVQRSLALEDRVKAALAAGKLDRVKLVGAMMDAGTVDIRGAYILPDVLKVVGDDPQLATYTKLLADWQAAGAHRVDRARTGQYTDSGAIALMDAWYPLVAKQVLAPRLGPLVNVLPVSLDNLPTTKQSGSSFNNVGSYSWVTRDLRRLQAQPGPAQTSPQFMSQGYCGNGDLNACRAELRTTLQRAVDQVSAAQKTKDPAKWRFDKSTDEIQFTYLGQNVTPLEWQNRPTFQQVIGQ